MSRTTEGEMTARPALSDNARPLYTGTSLRRHDGDRYLRGQIAYTDDIVLPGMVHVALVRSELPHARITGIDATSARRHPGVLAVFTGADLAEHAGPIPNAMDPAAVGGQVVALRCLPVDKVVYAGQPLAAVVAETRAAAAAGAGLVEVDLEALPFVLDAEQALADGAPLLYEQWGSNLMLGGTTGEGDVDAVAASAPHRVDGTIVVGRSAPAPIEPRAYVAEWSPGEQRLTWYGTTQAPHPLRHAVAGYLGLRERQVHVVAPPVGGSFGYKNFGHPEEYLVCLLARLVGRPVKFVEDRTSTLRYGAKDTRIRFWAAFESDGRVRAVRCELLANHGAAAATGAFGMAFAAALSLPSGYLLEAFHGEYQVVVTNKGPWSPMRPFGKEASALLMERVMDLVAERTGLSPIEVRRRNWIPADRFPYVTTTGLELDSGNYAGLLDAVLTHWDYAQARAQQSRDRAAGRLTGIGFGFEVLPEGADIPGSMIGSSDTSTVRMDPSGEVVVLTGVTSPGNGNDTAIMQIVADRLGVEMGDVQIVQGDTDRCPFGFGNVSSRGILTGGASAALAADDIAVKLRRVAAALLEAREEQIVLDQGRASVIAEPERAVPLAQVASSLYTLGAALVPDLEPTLESTRTFQMRNVRHHPDDQGRIMPFTTYANGLYAAIVEVDRETGVVTLRRHVMAHDCGVMINPRFVDGQFTGGVVTGLGAALGEEVRHGDDGLQRTDVLKTYMMPRATEVPRFEMSHQVTPSPFTPLGTKGAGEGGVACSMAALLNAVNDALAPLGARVDELPLTPERVLSAIHEART